MRKCKPAKAHIETLAQWLHENSEPPPKERVWPWPLWTDLREPKRAHYRILAKRLLTDPPPVLVRHLSTRSSGQSGSAGTPG